MDSRLSENHGELDVDLRSNIAAEARAKIVYERLINFTDDAGSIDALKFLMTREITHMKAFMAALESMGKDPFDIGKIPLARNGLTSTWTTRPEKGTTEKSTLVDLGTRGGEWEIVEAPAFKDVQELVEGGDQNKAKGERPKARGAKAGKSN